jgi:hypothetical protein
MDGPERPKSPKVAPKDTAGDGYVKPRPGFRGKPPPDLLLFPAVSVPLFLAIALKIRINRAIRGSRPGAERTVSAISPIGDVDVAGPVGPSSRASAF